MAFKKKEQTKLGDRVLAQDNHFGSNSLIGGTSLADLLNVESVTIPKDLITLHRTNYLLQEIVNKLTNDLSNLEYYQEDKGNGKLVEYLNRREFRMMIKQAWYNYLFKGYFILAKSPMALGSPDVKLEVITLESSILEGLYTAGRLSGIRINAMKIDTDAAGMNREFMIYGNREYASNKIVYNAPLDCIREQIRTIEYGRGFLQSIFSRGAIAPVLLTLRPGEPVPSVTQEASIMSRLKKAFRQKDTPANVVPVTGFDIHNVGTNTRDMAIIDAIKKAEESALIGMGIQPEVLGLNEKQEAMATKSDGILVYYNSTIIPMAEQFLGALSMWLNKYSNYTNVDVAVDNSKLPFTKDKEIEAIARAAGTLQVLTRNEVRERFNYEPIDESELDNGENEEENKDE